MARWTIKREKKHRVFGGGNEVDSVIYI